jgi:hypothetical protein
MQTSKTNTEVDEFDNLLKKPTHLQAHFIFSHRTMPSQKKIKRACKPTHPAVRTLPLNLPTQQRTKRKAADNSTYKKLAVQWLNKTLCFVSSSLLADSLVLRKRQLLVAANR